MRHWNSVSKVLYDSESGWYLHCNVVLLGPVPRQVDRSSLVIVDPALGVSEIIMLTTIIVYRNPKSGVSSELRNRIARKIRATPTCTHLPALTLISTLILAPTVSEIQKCFSPFHTKGSHPSRSAGAMGCSWSFASAQNISGWRIPKTSSAVFGSGFLGSTTSRRGVKIDTGDIEYGVWGRMKCRFSVRSDSSGARSKDDSQLTGAVNGSTRWRVSSGKGTSTNEENGSMEDIVSEEGGAMGNP